MSSNDMRVALEVGLNGKKVVAVAPDWPGLERGAKTEEAAVAQLLLFVPRYAPVAKLAGLEGEFSAVTAKVRPPGSSSADAVNPVDAVKVVEHYQGTGSTDFWGISFAFSSIDLQSMSGEELERELKLMRSCWAFFDDVRQRVSAEMQKGPRGGGRDRDRIVRHVVFTEMDWSKKLGVHTSEAALLSEEGLQAHRDAYCTAIRTLHSEGKMARTWPLRYLIRHTAFHTLDHAWEMQDKDLTGK